MANMTLSIPDELLVRMRKFNEIKWSEVARRAIEQRTRDLETIDDLLPQLVDLFKREVIRSKLLYSREDDGKFTVYDHSVEQDNPWVKHSFDKLFSKLFLFKGVSKRILPLSNRDLPDIAEFVNLEVEGREYPHVEGETLKQAVERAVGIYRLAGRLQMI